MTTPTTPLDEAADRDSKYEHKRKMYWREKSVGIFHEVAQLPGYEPVDEDTISAIVIRYADEMSKQFTLGKDEGRREADRELIERLKSSQMHLLSYRERLEFDDEEIREELTATIDLNDELLTRLKGRA